MNLLRGWYRLVATQPDATLYEGDRQLEKALARLPTKGVTIKVIDVVRTGGIAGKVIRVESRNPLNLGRWYIAEVVKRKKKKPVDPDE